MSATFPSKRPPRRRPETHEPGERLGIPTRRLAMAYLLGVAVPIALAASMIPLRADHGPTMAIVLVVPVVAIAVPGATGPAVVTALSAGLAYNVFLTRPYYRPAIHSSDDVVATVTLVVVGLIVGVLSSRAARFGARASVRRTELRHLIEFTQATIGPLSAAELTQAACEHITAVLDLRECRWVPGQHDTAAPLLLPDGNVMGYVTELNPDRAKLPQRLELPAFAGTTLIGRFVLTAGGHRVASYEERLTAATIASLFASALSREDRDDPGRFASPV